MFKNVNTKVNVYKCKEVRNYFVANVTKPEIIIPKSVRVFFLILMALGADCGISETLSGKIPTVVKYYLIIFTIVDIGILASAFGILAKEIWYWSSLFTGIINFLILNKTKYKVYGFLRNMHDMGKGITAIERGFFGVIISMYLVTMFFSKISFAVYRCARDKQIYCQQFSDLYNALYAVACISVDAVPVVQIVICYYIYCNVKFLRASLESDFNIDTFTKRYIALAECCDKIRPFYKNIFMVELFLSVPRMMTTAWFMLVYINQNASWYSYVSEWFFTLYMSCQITVSAILVQMAKCQIEDIKIIMNERRIDAQNSEIKEEVAQTLNYKKMRHLHYDLWGVIPTDLRLPLTLVSICVTYLIVIIQLSHLYD